MQRIWNLLRRRRAAEAALRESRARFHTLVETAPALIFATDRSGRNSFVNERYQSYTGLSFAELCGEGWLAVIHPEDREAALAESNQAQAILRPLERRLRIRRHDGQWRWFLSRTEPVIDASDKTPFAWLGISIDIDEQVYAEEREQLLARELDHRAKNLLTVVQSIVRLTRAADAKELKEIISGRIQALALSHSLLAASRWQGVELDALIREELAPFSTRALFHGPSVHFRPEAAQAVALVVHELATNAAKYGCFSVQSGMLDVRWGYAQDMLEVHWEERGGPTVIQPAKNGFGSTLMKASIERQLKGRFSVEWRSEGLLCVLRIPATQTVAPDATASTPLETHSGTDAVTLSGLKVLIVEDETLIAMEMSELLIDAGCVTIGPAASVSEAVDLIVSAHPDVSILDVNLGGERSYPVADILAAKGIPFAFATGYAALADLPARFGEKQMLSKPIKHADLIKAINNLLSN